MFHRPAQELHVESLLLADNHVGLSLLPVVQFQVLPLTSQRRQQHLTPGFWLAEGHAFTPSQQSL